MLELAREGFDAGETPVGAALVDIHGNIVADGRNRIVEDSDPSAHAELLAIRQACKLTNSERLPELILISSLEPCLMCSGLIIHARIPEIAFMAASQWPGLRHYLEKFSDSINHRPAWRILDAYEDSASNLLTRFFQDRRKLTV